MVNDNINSSDIICALATPPGKAALAIVRVSGPGAVGLVAKSITALSGLTPGDSRKIHHDYFIDSSGAAIDEITAIPYFAPKSYTAEDMVEIICHGGYAASRAIISHLAKLGARLAEPGEFTKRAFLNGRISLSQAEAVAAAIEAKSELALKAAARNLRGELYDKIDIIRQAIADLLTLLEAEIDFSEEEIDKTPYENIKVILERQIRESENILKGYDFGRGLNAGYRIAIVGRANVGKSSLLNALLKRQRAIVTDIPGTTRDTLTEWIEIDGFPILLTDTAGLRQSGDIVETLGQERTRDEIQRSDLVLFMIDTSTEISREDIDIYKTLSDIPRLLVANKIDLGSKPDISKKFSDIASVFISALNGDGLDKLRQAIAAQLHLDKFSLDSALLATERQYHAMSKAVETLLQTRDELDKAPHGEVISIYLRETLDYLGELVGETTTDDILNNIFGRFCIGK